MTQIRNIRRFMDETQNCAAFSFQNKLQQILDGHTGTTKMGYHLRYYHLLGTVLFLGVWRVAFDARWLSSLPTCTGVPGNPTQSWSESSDSPSPRSRPRNVPTFLWGICSMESDSERERREVIRETYLSFYKDEDRHLHRICSLNDLLQGTVAFEDCQVAYAFFVGANPSGPSELLFPNESYPILAAPNRTLMEQDEHDIVYLNIRENMEDGKSPTWLK